MTPSKSVIDRWQPDQLTLPGLGRTASSLITESDSADRLFDLPRSDWDGIARSAATDRAGEELAWAKRVAGKIDALDDALAAAARAIAPMVSAVHEAVDRAKDDHCTVIDDTDPEWKVHYAPPDADDLTDDQIVEKEYQWSTALRAKADAAEDVCADHARKIATAISALDRIAPPALGLSAQDGRTDALAGRDGWTAQELRRVGDNLQAAGLTDWQIRRLLTGQRVDLPVGAQEYLHQFFGNLDRRDTLDLKNTFDGLNSADGTQWSKALSDGLLALSNENVGSPGVHGGFGSLPQWTRDWVERRDARLPSRDLVTDVGMARLLATSRAIPPGERFGTELIRKSTDLASRNPKDRLSLPDPHPGSGADSDDDPAMRTYDGAIDDLLTVGARNHASAAAILSGEYSDTGEKVAGYDRDDTLRTLMSREWRDNGAQAGHLVDWIRDYGSSDDPTEVALADRAFSGLFDFTTTADPGHNNFAGLMNMNHDRDALGQINPALADALRKAANPYLNLLANPNLELGTPHPGLNLTDEANPAEYSARAARLLTLIATDDAPDGIRTPDNPDGVNAATELYRDIIDRTGANASYAAQHAGLASTLGKTSYDLQELGRAGIVGAQFDHVKDGHDAVRDANDAAANAQRVLSTASAIASVIPRGGEYVSAVIDASSPWLQRDVEFTAPEFRAPDGHEVLGIDNVEAQRLATAYSILQGSEIHGMPENWRLPDGQLKPIRQLLADNGGDAELVAQAMREFMGSRRPEMAHVISEYESGARDGSDQARLDGFDDQHTYETWILEGKRG